MFIMRCGEAECERTAFLSSLRGEVFTVFGEEVGNALRQGFALYPVATVGGFEGNSVADFGVDVAGLEHHAAVFAVVEHFDFVVGGVCAQEAVSIRRKSDFSWESPFL